MGCVSSVPETSTNSFGNSTEVTAHKADEPFAVSAKPILSRSEDSTESTSTGLSESSASLAGDSQRSPMPTIAGAMKRLSVGRRRSKTRGSDDSHVDSDIKDVDIDDEEERDDFQHEHRRRAPSAASSSLGSTDGVWNGKLSVMRKLYSWEDIPLEFFVDKYVDDEDGTSKVPAQHVRGRLSVAKKARPRSIRHRLSLSRSKHSSHFADRDHEQEDDSLGSSSSDERSE